MSELRHRKLDFEITCHQPNLIPYKNKKLEKQRQEKIQRDKTKGIEY